MTNLLDLVPPLDRQLRQFKDSTDTDSDLAGYLADAVEALNYRWNRDYVVDKPAPKTYVVSPDVDPLDKRPVILMASIIYMMGNWSQEYVRDGDFANDTRTVNAQINPLLIMIGELKKILPEIKLASATTAPMRGFNNIFNREAYPDLFWLAFDSLL
jgi:hypothetical protein